MLGTHYRQPIDWTVDKLVQARNTMWDISRLMHDVAFAPVAPNAEVVAALSDDLNTPKAISILHGLMKSAAHNQGARNEFMATLSLLGVFGGESVEDLNPGYIVSNSDDIDKEFVSNLVDARLEARKAKDFKEGDRIRDELAKMGIALKDSKDPKTGEIVTTWEVAR